MQFKCKRHNRVVFDNSGFLGLVSKPRKEKIEGITRGKTYVGQIISRKVWTPDYDETRTFIYIQNDNGKWQYYDPNIFNAVEASC